MSLRSNQPFRCTSLYILEKNSPIYLLAALPAVEGQLVSHCYFLHLNQLFDHAILPQTTMSIFD